MKITIHNRTPRATRVRVKRNHRLLTVTVTDSREGVRHSATPQGIALEPGQTFVGDLPMTVTAQMVTLGCVPAPREREMPRMRDGHIGLADLVALAAIFDQIDEGFYSSAAEFVEWAAADIIGTDQYHASEEARLVAAGGSHGTEPEPRAAQG